MSQQLVQVNFTLAEGWSAEDHLEEAHNVAPGIGDYPGLEWKIWIKNPETGERGGIYLFDNAEDAEAYVESKYVDDSKDMFAEIEIKQWEIIDELTEITGGPPSIVSSE